MAMVLINSLPNERLRAAGFTLPELLVTVTISAVLLGVAVPPLRGLLNSVNLSGATNDMLGGLLLARSEAIKRGTRVSLCKSGGGFGCISSGGWDQGWIVFADSNGNAVRDPGEPIISRTHPLAQGWRVRGNQPVSRYISFDPNGRTKLVSGLAFQAGTITVCRGSGTQTEARQIILNGTGRPRVHKTVLPSC